MNDYLVNAEHYDITRNYRVLLYAGGRGTVYEHLSQEEHIKWVSNIVRHTVQARQPVFLRDAPAYLICALTNIYPSMTEVDAAVFEAFVPKAPLTIEERVIDKGGFRSPRDAIWGRTVPSFAALRKDAETRSHY